MEVQDAKEMDYVIKVQSAMADRCLSHTPPSQPGDGGSPGDMDERRG